MASCDLTPYRTLLEEIGCRGLSLRFPQSASPEAVVYTDGRFATTAREGVHVWHFAWKAFEPTRRPMAGLDDVLLQSVRTRELGEAADPVAAVERTLLQDLGRTWRLDAVAWQLGRSRRTLQRQLSSAGNTFADTAHFSRSFKQRYDVAPSQWRQR